MTPCASNTKLAKEADIKRPGKVMPLYIKRLCTGPYV